MAKTASFNRTIEIEGHQVQLFAEYLAPPPALLVLGAGDDARPVVALARMMGWHVTVADARSQLATRERFPGANVVATLTKNEALRGLDISMCDAAVVMTHSYEQDRALLLELLHGDAARGLPYIGILGARRRTRQLVKEAAESLGLGFADCMARLHSPVGLSLGATTPETIALSIVAEIQSAIGAVPSKAGEGDEWRPGERLGERAAATQRAANVAERG
jgi:xanthine/CO dehydrogenase XdhC/CoxF family maturation factor